MPTSLLHPSSHEGEELLFTSWENRRQCFSVLIALLVDKYAQWDFLSVLKLRPVALQASQSQFFFLSHKGLHQLCECLKVARHMSLGDECPHLWQSSFLHLLQHRKWVIPQLVLRLLPAVPWPWAQAACDTSERLYCPGAQRSSKECTAATWGLCSVNLPNYSVWLQSCSSWLQPYKCSSDSTDKRFGCSWIILFYLCIHQTVDCENCSSSNS